MFKLPKSGRGRVFYFPDLRLAFIVAAMLPEIEHLLVLQDRDQKIKALQDELQRAPADKVKIASDLAAATASYEKSKTALNELEIRKKKLELDAQSKRDAIIKFKNQQFQTRKNEEFQALGHEIARAEKDIMAIEDTEIEIMEATEQIRTVLAGKEQEFATAKQQAASRAQVLQDKIGTLQKRLEDMQADRKKLAEGISDPDLLYRYTRLFDKKNGTPVVPVEHEVCMGCHMKITTQVFHKVRAARELTYCEQCGRILYHD